MSEDQKKFKRYLLEEFLWELSQHPPVGRRFDGIEEASVEVVMYKDSENLRIRVTNEEYDIRLSWRKDTPPRIDRVN